MKGIIQDGSEASVDIDPMPGRVRAVLGQLDTHGIRAFTINLFKTCGVSRAILAAVFRCSVSEVDRAARVESPDLEDIIAEHAPEAPP